jgi:LPXTG-site transpeptidase (sortase) family protein
MSQKRSAFSSGLLLLLIGALVAAAYLMPSGGKDPEFRPLSSPAKPIELVVPALKIHASIKPIEVNAQNVLDPPEDVHQVGWWRRSVRPGNDHGQTVLTGHTVHTGGGVMNRLTQLHPGNVVRVVTPKGTMVYRTTKVMTLSKAQLARRSTALFGQGRDSNRLVLVTCTGWTGSTYTSNVVAFAEPLGVRAHPAKKKS